MSNTIKVKLLRTHVVARSGDIVRAFGHDFTMQPNGECHCDMHKDFIPTEVAAGRVEVIQPEVPKTKEVVPELAEYSYEIKDYYGTKSLDNLMTGLSRVRKDLLIEFASSRLSVDIPDSIANKQILRQIRGLVETAYQQHFPEQEKDKKQENTDVKE